MVHDSDLGRDIQHGVAPEPSVELPVVNDEPSSSPGPVLRRTTRTSKPPDRLQVDSWKGQSYEQGKLPVNTTASQSIGNSDYLHPTVPRGGEGINDGGYASSTLVTFPGLH